jgi:NitT/TauT family transport system substrate-binding protein
MCRMAHTISNRSLADMKIHLVLALCLLAGCASPTATVQSTATAVPAALPTVSMVEPAAGSGGTPVTIQVVGTTSEAPMYIATERGYFAEQGISPQFITLESTAKAIPALANGQIDVAAGVLSAGLFNVVDAGVGIHVVAPQSENSGCAHSGTWVLVRKDLVDGGVVRSAADLRGRNIGLTSKGSTVEYFADAVLRQGGLQPTDVHYVEMGFPDMGAAFSTGAIDAAMGSEPTATSYVDRGLASKWLCASDVLPNIQYTYLLYSPQFATEHAALAQHWMTAYLRGARDWQKMQDTGDGKQAIFSYLGKYTPVPDPSVLERATLSKLSPEDPIDLENIRSQMAWAHERGYVTHEPSAESLVDTQFIEYATQAVGRS